GLVGEAGAGEQEAAGLVQRDGEHARVVGEDRLHPVAVVDVDVHVGDPAHALVEQPGDGDGGVVVDAEPRGAVGHGVVQAAGGREGGLRLAVQDGVGGGQGGAGGPGR